MYNLIGKLFILSIVLLIAGSSLALFTSRDRLIHNMWIAGFFASILDFFYLPLKFLFYKFSDPRKLEKRMVSLKNISQQSDFAKTKKRIMLIPHCMRNLDCPAHTTKHGIQCKSCGKCICDDLKAEVKKYGYDFYIVTGSSFVKNILKENPVDGVLVIACNYEINKGMRALEKTGVITYGIPMLNDGCYNTEVDYALVKKTLKMFA